MGAMTDPKNDSVRHESRSLLISFSLLSALAVVAAGVTISNRKARAFDLADHRWLECELVYAAAKDQHTRFPKVQIYSHVSRRPPNGKTVEAALGQPFFLLNQGHHRQAGVPVVDCGPEINMLGLPEHRLFGGNADAYRISFSRVALSPDKKLAVVDVYGSSGVAMRAMGATYTSVWRREDLRWVKVTEVRHGAWLS